MTQPVQEPSQDRTNQAQAFRTRQLYRRPSSTFAGTSTAFVTYTNITALAAVGDVRFEGTNSSYQFLTNDTDRFTFGASANYSYMLIINAADCAVKVLATVVYHSPHRAGKFFLSISEDNVDTGSVGTPVGGTYETCLDRATGYTGHSIAQQVEQEYECNFPGHWAVTARLENTALTGGTQAIDYMTIVAYTLGSQPV